MKKYLNIFLIATSIILLVFAAIVITLNIKKNQIAVTPKAETQNKIQISVVSYNMLAASQSKNITPSLDSIYQSINEGHKWEFVGLQEGAEFPESGISVKNRFVDYFKTKGINYYCETQRRYHWQFRSNICSRYPIVANSYREYPIYEYDNARDPATGQKSARVVQCVLVNTPFGEVIFCNLHTKADTMGEQQGPIKEALKNKAPTDYIPSGVTDPQERARWIYKNRARMIVTGDFNSVPTDYIDGTILACDINPSLCKGIQSAGGENVYIDHVMFFNSKLGTIGGGLFATQPIISKLAFKDKTHNWQTDHLGPVITKLELDTQGLGLVSGTGGTGTSADQQNSSKIRIMTYNVDNEPECVRDSIDIQKARMEKLADSIIANKVDIASLQEVRDRIHNNDGEVVEPNYIDEAKYLRDVLQGRNYPMNLIDSFEPTGEGGFRVITLSRFPATGDRTVFRFGGSGRHSHYVNLNTSLGPLIFVSIHTRYQEAADYIDWLHNEYLPSQFPTDKTRVVIAGDFNASAGGDPFRAYIADYPAFNGRNVDYITAHKTSVFQSAGNPAIVGTEQPTAGFCEGHSDLHWVVIADVKLKDGIATPQATTTSNPQGTQSVSIFNKELNIGIISFNIDKDGNRAAAYQSIATSIAQGKKWDIVGFQEMREPENENLPNRHDSEDFVNYFSGQGIQYDCEKQRVANESFSSVICSRFPIKQNSYKEFEIDSGRVLQCIETTTPAGDVIACNTHVQVKDNIQGQFDEIKRLVFGEIAQFYIPSNIAPASRSRYAEINTLRTFVTGDFNAPPNFGPQMTSACASNVDLCKRDWHYIDNIIYKSGQTTFTPLSAYKDISLDWHTDHLGPIIAEFKIKPLSEQLQLTGGVTPSPTTARTQTPSPTRSLVPTRTITPTRTPTVTPTETPTRTPTNSRTPTPTVTMTPTSTPTITPTRTPTPPSVAMCDRACGVCGWRDTAGVCHTTGPLPTLVSTIPVTTVTGTSSQGLGMCCYKTCINNSCKTVSGYGTDSCSTDGASCAVTKAGVLSPTISIYMSTTPGVTSGIQGQGTLTPTKTNANIAQVTGVQGGSSQGSAQGALPSTTISTTPSPPVSGNVGWLLLVVIPIAILMVGVIL